MQQVAALPYRPSGNSTVPTNAPLPNDAEVDYDNLIIADMRVKGYTWEEVSEKTGLAIETCRNKWQSIRHHWLKKRLSLVDGYMHEELHKLEQLEAEYWRSYRASSQIVEYSIIDEKQGKLEKRHEVQAGDPRYLDGILKCMQDRAKRLGLYKMEKAASELADTVRTVIELPEGTDNARIIGAVADAIQQLHQPETATIG